jgi:capsular exopolysaccharide synthesis family protein
MSTRAGWVNSKVKSVAREKGFGKLTTRLSFGDGKSTTAANLAVVMAQGDAKVILVDSDLRRPSIHRFFGLSNSVGLTSLLIQGQELSVDEVLEPIEDVPNLSVLTSGPLPPNPAEVLKSARMSELLAKLQDHADVLVMDSPPLLVVADGAILATRANATLLVFECGQTRYDAARKALDVLDKVGVKPVGAVVNKLDRARVGGYYYYYAYRYRYGEYYGGDGKGGGSGRGRGPDGGRGSGSSDRIPSTGSGDEVKNAAGSTRHGDGYRPSFWDRVRDSVSSLLG